jgi:hypothetical protein
MPQFHVQAEAATNTHFDTDGLVGVWCALNPGEALKRERLLVQIAQASDFAEFEDWDAWRIRSVLDAYSDSETSPLPKEVFEGSYADQCGRLYSALLELLPEIMNSPAKFEKHWITPEARLRQAEDWIKSGKVGLREDSDLDLAVFDLPDGITEDMLPAEARHRATKRMAILLRGPKRFVFYYRYETWVQFVSRPFRPRVDLRPLAKLMTEREGGQARWESPEPGDLAPSLLLHGATQSGITAVDFEALLRQALKDRLNPFDPFDPR